MLQIISEQPRIVADNVFNTPSGGLNPETNVQRGRCIPKGGEYDAPTDNVSTRCIFFSWEPICQEIHWQACLVGSNFRMGDLLISF